jgi:hypothetical protein
MTIDDLIEGRIEGLTMDNFPAPQVETVEVPIFIIPTWIKWVCRGGLLVLVILLVRDFLKTAESKKRLKEIELLKMFNDNVTASKIEAEDKLAHYGLK